MGISGGQMAYVGEQRVFGAAIPAGWLECDGSAVLRADYPALFLAIGETYGAGDGATTFNLPDKRGRGSIGRGQGSGLTDRTQGQRIGAETVALSAAQMPSHSHGLSVGVADAASPGDAAKVDTATSAAFGASLSTGSNGSGSAHTNMQPVEVDAWGIKF